MKIALVRKDYTRSKGGAEGYVVTLSAQLAAKGHEVHVFANKIDAHDVEGPAGRSLAADRITFHQVPVPNLRTFAVHVWFAKKAEKMLREEEFDIINGLSRIWYQDIYRVGDPLFVHWLHSHPPNIIDRVLGLLNPKQQTMLSIEKKIFRAPSLKRVIAISRLDRGLLQRYYGVPEEKVRVIYNGVDRSRFFPLSPLKGGNRSSRREVRSKLGVPENQIVLLFVGMDFKRKGLAYLIEALAQLGGELRHVHCLVVSRDNPKKYRRLARQSGVDGSITFASATPEIEKIYRASDIFVFPTLYDPFANVHLEALSCGLPVITTSCAGGAEVIEEGGNGFVLHEPQDTARMAQCILELLDPLTRRRFSESAVESVKDFTVERNTQEVAALYEEVVREKRLKKA